MNKDNKVISYLKNQQSDYVKLNDEVRAAHHILSDAAFTLMHNYSNGMNRQEVLEMYWILYGVQKLLFYFSNHMNENNEKMEKYIYLLEEK